MSLFTELKRRNVFRVTAAYLAGAWLLIEVAETLFPLFGFGDIPARLTAILLAIGFPITLVLSWVYELTPAGLKLEKDIDRAGPTPRADTRRLDRAIIVLLVLALGYFAVDKFVLEPGRVAQVVEATAQQARSEALVESYGEKSIAVLPFVNRSADPGQEYFSDGISEEILNLLSRIPQLRVVSSSSSFSYKSKDIPITEVAAQLKVGHVLEGSVRKDSNRVRISAQLIEARSDTQLWSKSFEAELENIFALQREIAKDIGVALKFALLGPVEGGELRTGGVEVANPAAYDAFLRGRELARFRMLGGAIEHLRRSLRLDGNFAPAHAQLAITIVLAGHDKKAAQRKAMPHLDRARALDPDLPEVYGGQALLALMDSEYETAALHARKALDLNPNYNDAMNWLQIALQKLGQFQEAETVLKRMLEIDPLAPLVAYNYASLLSLTGRFEEATQQADLLLARNQAQGSAAHTTIAFNQGRVADGLYWSLRERAMDPGGWPLDLLMGLTWIGEYDEARRVDLELAIWPDIAEGRVDDALTALQRSLEAEPAWAYETESVIGLVLHMAGRFGEALPHLEHWFENVPPARRDFWTFRLFGSDTEMMVRLAQARRETGDHPGAQAALETALREQAELHALGMDLVWVYRADALIAAFNGKPDDVIAALQTAMQRGHRDPQFFDDPMFDDYREDSRFVTLQQGLDEILSVERRKTLEMICLDNPVPDDWQPMPETCVGVEEQNGL